MCAQVQIENNQFLQRDIDSKAIINRDENERRNLRMLRERKIAQENEKRLQEEEMCNLKNIVMSLQNDMQAIKNSLTIIAQKL